MQPLNNLPNGNRCHTENYEQKDTCSASSFNSRSINPLTSKMGEGFLSTNENIQQDEKQCKNLFLTPDVASVNQFKTTNTQRTIMAESIQLEDVINDSNNQDGKYNGSNHWVNGNRPDNYDDVQKKLKTTNWVNGLKETYEEFIIPADDVKLLFQAYQTSRYMGISWINGNVVESKADDLDDIFDASNNKKRIEEIEKKLQGKFARTDYASFKNTRWKSNAEYNTSLRKLYESLILSDFKHSPLSYYPTDCQDTFDDLKVYLFPWQDIDSDREFRVFVNDNQITAISQQDLYQSNKTLVALSEGENRSKKIKQWCDIIEDYFQAKISSKIKYISSYVLDIAIIDKDGKEVAYPIELNPFGKEYTSGSSLFNWIKHENILYGANTDNLYFRYTE